MVAYWSCEYFTGLWIQKYQIRRDILLVNYILYLISWSFITTWSIITTWCSTHHCDSIYSAYTTCLANIKGTPCLLLISEWIFLFIGVFSDNTVSDHVIKRLNIIIWFISFILPWIDCCYTASCKCRKSSDTCMCQSCPKYLQLPFGEVSTTILVI